MPDLDTNYVADDPRSHVTEHNETNTEVNSLRGRVANLETADEAGWDDLRVSLARGQTGATDPPTYAIFRDTVYANAFAATGVDALYFDCQLPHSWVAGTGIRPHIHWSPGNSTNTGSVVWRLDYTWANPVNDPGSVFPAVQTLSVTDPADGVAYKHQIAPFGELDGTGMRESSVLMCRIWRDGSDGDDTFTASAYGLSVDFHIRVQGFGSDDEYPGDGD